MNKEALNRLNNLVVNTPDKLLQISEADMSKKTSVEKWSKKEILGHLIDSATINHHRLIELNSNRHQQLITTKIIGLNLIFTTKLIVCNLFVSG